MGCFHHNLSRENLLNMTTGKQKFHSKKSKMECDDKSYCTFSERAREFFRMNEDISDEVFAIQCIFQGVIYEKGTFVIFVDADHKVVCDEAKNDGSYFQLKFECSDTYPTTPPTIHIDGNNYIIDDLLKHLKEQASKILHSVMIYNLIQLTLKWLYEFGLQKQPDLHTEMLEKEKLCCKLRCHETNLCNICSCEKTIDILSCSANHFTCSDCINNYVSSIIGSNELLQRKGGLCCLALHDTPFNKRPTVFHANVVRPILFDSIKSQYDDELNTNTGERIDDKHDNLRIPVDLYNIKCPKCDRVQDPHPDGCIAVKCRHCDQAFCWMCLQKCQEDAHEHCRVIHKDYFPPETEIKKWHANWRWHKIKSYLCTLSTRVQKKNCIRNSRIDLDGVGLWPLPTEAPLKQNGNPIIAATIANSLSVVKESIQNGYFLDEPNEFGMTALMYACRMGNTDIVTLLLEYGASPYKKDYKRREIIDFAFYNPNRQSSIRVISALKNMYPWINFCPSCER